MKTVTRVLHLSLLVPCLLWGMENNNNNNVKDIIAKINDAQKPNSLLTFGSSTILSHEEMALLASIQNEFIEDTYDKKTINKLNAKPTIGEHCNKLQPTVELTNFNKGVDYSIQEKAIKFEPKTQDIFIENDQESLIERIEARLEDETKCNVGLGIRKDALIEQHKFTITDLNKAQCLCIDPYNHHLLIGSKDGAITIYDMATLYNDKAVKVTSKLAAHSGALHTLGILKPTNKKFHMLLSRDAENNVFLWNLDSQRPLICVRGKHDNNYLSPDGELLIQSHAVKTIGSQIISSYFSENRSFNIPTGWFEGGWSNCLSDKIISPQTLYIYFLGLAHKLSNAQENNADKFLSRLLKAPVRRMFEPEISNVFEQFIKARAQDLKVTLK